MPQPEATSEASRHKSWSSSPTTRPLSSRVRLFSEENIEDHQGHNEGTADNPAKNIKSVNYTVKSSFLLSFLESVPDVAAKLKEPSTSDRKLKEIVKTTEKAAVLVLVYWRPWSPRPALGNGSGVMKSGCQVVVQTLHQIAECGLCTQNHPVRGAEHHRSWLRHSDRVQQNE